MLDLKLAAELIKICAEVNDSKGITLSVDNVECRIYLPDDPSAPINLPLDTALVVIAGSYDFTDWLKNAEIHKRKGPLGCYVHGGILDCYEKIQHALRIALKGCTSVIFGAHSQGGGISIMAAADFWQKGFTVPAVYTFGAPMIASQGFKTAYIGTGIETWRIVVGSDGVPTLPPIGDFHHCGTGVFFDPHGKPLKKRVGPGWKIWRYLWDFIDDHLPAYEYSRALDRVAS